MKYISVEYAGLFHVQGGGTQHPRFVTRDLLRDAFPSHVKFTGRTYVSVQCGKIVILTMKWLLTD